MAIFHFSASIVSRSQGRSVVASAAYRTRSRLHDSRLNRTFDYSSKRDLADSFILAPADAPAWVYDHSQLWNMVESVEKRKDSQLAREFTVALPRELNHHEHVGLLKDFVKTELVSRGMCVHVCIHRDAENHNPHAHLLATTRKITPTGFAGKDRQWNSRQTLESLREAWARSTNESLANANVDAQVDHRSYERREIDIVPTVHLGPAAWALEKKAGGVQTYKGHVNRMILASREEINDVKQQIELEIAAADQSPKERILAASRKSDSLWSQSYDLQQQERRMEDRIARLGVVDTSLRRLSKEQEELRPKTFIQRLRDRLGLDKNAERRAALSREIKSLLDEQVKLRESRPKDEATLASVRTRLQQLDGLLRTARNEERQVKAAIKSELQKTNTRNYQTEPSA